MNVSVSTHNIANVCLPAALHRAAGNAAVDSLSSSQINLVTLSGKGRVKQRGDGKYIYI